MKENIQINKSRDGSWDIAMACLALELTWLGTGERRHQRHAYRESWDQVDCVLGWKHSSTPETIQLKEEASLLHTAEWGGELADLGRGLCRRAVSGQSHPSQQGAVVCIFYTHCQHLTLAQGKTSPAPRVLRHWSLWQVNNTDSLRTSSLPHRTL